MTTQLRIVKATWITATLIFISSISLNAQDQFASVVEQNSERVVGMKIVDFKLEKNSDATYLQMDMKNIGRSISKGSVFVNLESENGYASLMLEPESFTALPGYSYQLLFNLPEQITKGDYKATGYFQFGDDEHFKAAEIGFGL